jgi:putative transcriptional regulator
MSDDFMTGEELGEKLLAAAREMATNQGVVVYSPAVSARKELKMSQTEFSKLLGVSVRTLQDWEQGRKQPSGAASTLLKVAAKHPEALLSVA